MGASLPGYFNLQQFTDTGALAAGGRLYTYAPGTTSLKVAYTDPAGLVAHTYSLDEFGGQYIALNARGELPAPLFLGGGGYSLTLKTAAGATVWTRRADGIAALGEDLASTDETKGAALVNFRQAGSGAVNRNLRDKMRERVSVRDFGAVGDGAADDTAAIVAAIAALPASGGDLILLDRHAITARIDVTKPVHFLGVSPGAKFQPVQAACTEIVWAGGTSTGAMIRFGKYGSGTNVLWGGGMSRVHLNGGGVCAHGLEVADASMGFYDRVSINNTTASGLHGITDGTKTDQPSAWNTFNKLYIDNRSAAASVNAHGVLIEAVNGSNAGVTLWRFVDLKVNHANGDGFRWNKGGDGFVFEKPQFFRADSETGWSCNFASTDAADICNHAVFNYPIASAGMNFAKAGLHLGTTVNAYDSQNINTGNTSLLYGPGAGEVAGYSTFGQHFGPARLGSALDVVVQDAMCLVFYDTANNIVHTNSGAWLIAGSGTNAAASSLVGSGLNVKTTNSSGDTTLLSHCAAPNGMGTAQYPSMQVGIDLLTFTDVKVRWGFFDSNGDPAGDGVWIEFDPTLSGGKYRLIASRGSTQTVVVNPYDYVGSSISRLRWRIDVAPGVATFYAAGEGTGNPQLWTYMGQITTNVPITTTPMAAGVFIKTTTTAVAQVRVADIKLAQRTNYI